MERPGDEREEQGSLVVTEAAELGEAAISTSL